MIRKFSERAPFLACAIMMLLSTAACVVDRRSSGADEGGDGRSHSAQDRIADEFEQRFGRGLEGQAAGVRGSRSKHVNAGGGVFGLPVAAAVGDTTADPEKAVAVARRLVKVERVHAIVGPNASANALPIAERVIGPAAIPTVSFSATSPELTDVADSDFLFRTALSDIAQGPVLARVARERGFEKVDLLYVDDA